MSLLLALALLLPARAADNDLPVGAWKAWSETASEFVPDAHGRTDVALDQELGIELVPEQGWEVHGFGSVRRTGLGDLELDLYRLSARREKRDTWVEAGRLVRFGFGGFEPIDGARVGWDRSGQFAVNGWAGRLWDTETWHPGNTFVGGAELTWRPLDADGEPSRLVTGSASLETRLVDAELRERLGLGAAARGASGAVVFAIVEMETGFSAKPDPGLRAEVRGRIPLGATTLGGEVRWEDLPPPSEIGREPMSWLDARGYALAAGYADWRGGAWTARVSGGPVLRNGNDLGGQARLSAGWSAGHLKLGAFGAALTIGPSHVTGGGLEATWRSEELKLTCDSAVWAVRALDGTPDGVWETRVRGKAPVYAARKWVVEVGGEVTTGVDRVLVPWVRGGLVVLVELEHEREELHLPDAEPAAGEQP